MRETKMSLSQQRDEFGSILDFPHESFHMSAFLFWWLGRAEGMSRMYLKLVWILLWVSISVMVCAGKSFKWQWFIWRIRFFLSFWSFSGGLSCSV